MKSDWSIPKKRYNNHILKDNRFLIILEDNIFLTQAANGEYM